ncbi:MAG: hypothetical protein WAU47_13645 [Desulfobaccales bacterium]
MSQALAPVEVLAPATREQAEKAASLLLTLRQMEKELAARLKEWVKQIGPVTMGDLVYGPNLLVSYELDAKAVVQFLLEKGVEREAVWSLPTLSKTSVERGLKKVRPGLLESILSTAGKKVAERIDFRKHH